MTVRPWTVAMQEPYTEGLVHQLAGAMRVSLGDGLCRELLRSSPIFVRSRSSGSPGLAAERSSTEAGER